MKKEPYGMGDPPCPEKCVPQHVAAQLRRTDNLIFRKMNEIGRAAGVEDITFMHGWILRHLYLHQDQEVCQRDIERDFSITRSTTTNILQLMEKKQYIRRVAVPQDARLKRIVLTEKGIETHNKTIACLQELNRQVEAALTEQEREEMLRLLGKLQAHLEGRCT